MALVVSTAAVTYALTRFALAPNPVAAKSPSAEATSTQVSAGEQYAAERHLCDVFAEGIKKVDGAGGVVEKGEVNPFGLLRRVLAIEELQKALTPAIRPELSTATAEYVVRNLALLESASNDEPIKKINRLNQNVDDAKDAVIRKCEKFR